MIYPQKTYIGVDTVLYEPHSTDATKIVLKVGGQFSLPDGTLIRLRSDKTLDINDDLTTDDTLTADTWYHIWCNASVCKFAETGTTAPSDMSNGVRLRGGVYVTNRKHIQPFGMRSTGELYFTRHQLRVPWTNTGSTLPGNLRYSHLAVIGDYVYLFGGNTGIEYTNIIYRAPLSDPTSWTNTGSTLPGNLGLSHLAVIGDYVYLFGGYTGSATNVIYRAPLSDPTSWTNTGSTLPGNLSHSQLAVIGDYVYLFGGYTGSAYTNIIYRAPLSDPTSWTNTGSTLPGNLGYSQLAVIGDYVYLFGGYNTDSTTNVIYRAPLSDPTSWTNTGSTLPGGLRLSHLAVIGDYVYLFGGYTGSATNVIYRAPLSTYRSPIYNDTDIFSWILGRALSSHEIQENKPWSIAP